MEDLGSIIWLLVALGALIFSSSSKARKRAGEAAKRAKELQKETTDHEAWPSWDAPQPPRPQADETTGRPTPWPVVPAAPARQSRTPETARTTDAAHATPRQDAGKATEPTPQPTFRSTSEIPDTAPATPAAAPGGKQTGSPMAEGELMSQKRQPIVSIAARHNGVGNVVQSVKEAHENGTIAPDPVTEIREEFDLRRAVLYSEIMKPKFEEQYD